jgi:hypothetical protein
VSSSVRRGFAGQGTLSDRLIRNGRSVTAGVWYVSRIMDHQWPDILRRNHVRSFAFWRYMHQMEGPGSTYQECFPATRGSNFVAA